MDSKQKQKLKKFIKELDGVRGRHTELVSVYIPAGYDMNKIINHLQQEQGTANNIKDKNTRKNVIDSLERMIRHLRLYKKTPENGLAAFAGNTAEREGQVAIKVWSIEPPDPIQTRLYRCDQDFKLDLLKEMMIPNEVYGLIVIDNREANIALLKGTRIIDVASKDSMVPGKSKAGGQSQARFARLREIAAKDFYKKIADIVNKEFLGMKELKGIIIGGPGPTKDTFLDGNFLNNELKKKVIGVKDLSYTGEFGLNELVDKSNDLLAKEAITGEKKLVNRFLEMLSKEPDKVAYGKKEVEKALDAGAVDTLLISEDIGDEYIENMEEKITESGAKLEIISIESREGNQLKNLGGVAAILRFAIS